MNGRTVWVLFKRELLAFFGSPAAYVVGFFFLIFMAFNFWTAVQYLNSEATEYAVMDMFLTHIFAWFAQVLVIPVLTMRTFSEEYRLGTYESLMTAPVREWEVVIAKFCGVMAMYAALWAPTLLYALVFRLIAAPHIPVSTGPIWLGYAMVFLLGMFYTSIGLLVSSTTRNQLVAAAVTMACTCLLFFAGFLDYIVSLPYHALLFVKYISPIEHAIMMNAGLFDTRIPVFYLSCTLMMLLVTVKVVESRRWKA